jgi:hypothetical protein
MAKKRTKKAQPKEPFIKVLMRRINFELIGSFASSMDKDVDVDYCIRKAEAILKEVIEETAGEFGLDTNAVQKDQGQLPPPKGGGLLDQ